MQEITKDTVIADVLKLDVADRAVPLLQSIGMHCLGCVMASRETLEEACLSHGMDVNDLIAKISALQDQ